MRRLRIGCITAALLVATASSAFAECAWVLWTTRYVMAGGKLISESMLPTEAYTTKGECDRSRQRRETRDEERKRDSAERFYTCLPDTVDPRAPKAR